MPPEASSNLPSCWRIAPVNAPFSWPNSVLSTSSLGIAARFTATNGALARPASRWISRASSSLPVPVSPRMSTFVASFATFCTVPMIVARRLARADDELALVGLGNLFAQADDVATEILTLAGVGDERAQRLQIDVLRRVVIRAEAHRLDGDLELLDLRDDDDLDVRIVLLRDLEDLERR